MNAPKTTPKSIIGTAEEQIDALMKIHPKGYDLSLHRISDLLKKLGNPQNKMPPVIHVAGTNGKGSAIAFVRAILEAAGLGVHVDTSPHLVNWHERYRIANMGAKTGGGRLVEDKVLAEVIARVAKANDGQPITVFEVLSAVAFVLFSEWPADVALIEVGLGGRFDCTNVMEKTAISIITPISLDHESFLGNTIAKIAFEKAGIIKPNTPVIVGPQENEALEVIEQQAARQGAPVYSYGQSFNAFVENGKMVYQDEATLLDLDLPALPGEHQISNAATAIATARCFAEMHNFELTTAMIDQGLKSVEWPGRMQRLKTGHLLDLVPKGSEIWLDGGHNPGAAVMISEFLKTLSDRDSKPVTLICGMLDTKDPIGYFSALSSVVDRVITVPVATSDSGISPGELAQAAKKCGLKADEATSLTTALAQVKGQKSQRILIAGTLYLVGEALAKNGTPPV